MDYIRKINDLIGSNIDRDNVQYILDFVLLWNLFELRYCDKNCTKNKIENLNYWDISNLNWVFDYFKDRYINNSEKFNNLNFESCLKNIIKDNLSNWTDKEKTILHIIYRFRNNMFHWEKEIYNIEWQEENFENANKFLYELLKNNFSSN